LPHFCRRAHAMTFADICAARKHCADCRTRPEWRQAFGAPEICPFETTVESPREKFYTIQGVEIPWLTFEESRKVCQGCSKREGETCRKCYCKGEVPRPLIDVKVCPAKLFMRLDGKSSKP